jgi:hypothetical protein
MNTITISLASTCLHSPKFAIGEKVAIKSNCHPEEWATGRIIGLQLNDLENTWNYAIVLDYPQGFCEELLEEDLVVAS